jgi:hypothetical protein
MLEREYINPSNQLGSGDFSDPRVILVRKSDPRVCSLSDSECHVSQGFDTPTYVAIGDAASDEQLAAVAARYGVPQADLQEFRAA